MSITVLVRSVCRLGYAKTQRESSTVHDACCLSLSNAIYNNVPFYSLNASFSAAQQQFFWSLA